MAKVFQFTTAFRRNMMEEGKPGLYYALAKSTGDVSLDEMSERIQRSCTVKRADVLCVLRALQTEMIDSLQRGEIVRFGDIGSFYVTLHSSGVPLQKDVSVSLIKGAHIRYRPGKELRNALKTLPYGKYRAEADEEVPGEPEEPGGGEDDGESPDPIV